MSANAVLSCPTIAGRGTADQAAGKGRGVDRTRHGQVEVSHHVGCVNAGRPSRLRALVAAAVATATAATLLVTASAPAGADAVRVNDGSDASSTAYYLDVKNVTFANTEDAFVMVARHRELVPSKLTGVILALDVPKWMFTVYAKPGERPTLMRNEDGVDGDVPPVRCRGLRVRFVAAGEQTGGGRVAIRIPQKCLSRTKFVRATYQAANWHDAQYEYAPNPKSGDAFGWTRKIRRGGSAGPHRDGPPPVLRVERPQHRESDSFSPSSSPNLRPRAAGSADRS